MIKLAALRAHLLASPLCLKAEQIVTFAENGKITSYDGGRNNNFRIAYQANIILLEYEKGALELTHVLLEWLREHQPGLPDDALQFDADILNSEKVDLGFEIPLTEDILVTQEEGGTRLTLADEPVVDLDDLTGMRDAHVE